MPKRYYNLERETKEYLKTREARNSKPFREIKAINDIFLLQKVNNKLGSDYITNLNLNGSVIFSDASLHSSYAGTGNSFLDISGRNNHGTVSGQTFTNDGLGSFLHNNNSISFPNTINGIQPLQTAYCISVWVKLLTNPLVSNYFGFFAHQSSASASTGIPRLELGYASGNTIFFTTYNHETGANSAGSFAYILPLRQWINICAISGAGLKLVYINGQQVYSAAVTSNFPDFAHPTFLGYRNYNGLSSNLIIYNRALSALEILQNYNALRGRFGL
jgi:hypothetical protein